MSSPRPPLRLVGPSDRDAVHDGGVDRNEEADGEAHDAEPAEVEPPRTPLSPRFVVVALVVFQLLAASSYLGKYAALAQGDNQFRFAAAMTVPASLCLYVGAILLALRPGRGRLLFLAAATGFGLSLPAWGVGYGWSWPMAFGAILALAGAWYARAESRPDPSSAAQP